MSEYALEFQDVEYSYGKGTPFYRVALDHINLKIKKGRITGIIGHTGSGKSTLVQHMNGLLRPEQGKVLLDGADIWEKPKEIGKIAFKVGLVFQYPEYQLFEETVYKDVSYGPKNMGLSLPEIDKRVRESLRFVGFDEKMAEASPFELSGGQKRRVAIAGIIAMQPEILVLDEPAAGLDPKGREDIFGNVLNYQRKTGTTVIIVSHSMEDMAKYADDVVVMSKGKILLADECEKVFSCKKLLSEIGLATPQITRVMEYLKEMGMPVSENIFTVEKAVEELLPLLVKEKGGKPHA